MLTKNRSRMKNLALVTLGSSPASGVAVENQREFYLSDMTHRYSWMEAVHTEHGSTRAMQPKTET